MKDLSFIFITTFLAIAVWTGIELEKIPNETFVSKKLLELSTPINKGIDIKFLEELSKGQ